MWSNVVVISIHASIWNSLEQDVFCTSGTVRISDYLRTLLLQAHSSRAHPSLCLSHSRTNAKTQTLTHAHTHTRITSAFVWKAIRHVRAAQQQTATDCNRLQHIATHCNTLQHTAAHCSTLPHTATHCIALQQNKSLQHARNDKARTSSMLQHTATHCNTLQHTATAISPAQSSGGPCAEARSRWTCTQTYVWHDSLCDVTYSILMTWHRGLAPYVTWLILYAQLNQLGKSRVQNDHLEYTRDLPSWSSRWDHWSMISSRWSLII